MMKNFALIFDMDGVVVDNTRYHILAWQKFAKEFGYKVSAKTVKEKFIGRLGSEIMRLILKKDLIKSQEHRLNSKREAYYRKIYAKAIALVKGLPAFLKHLKSQNIKLALATSAPPVNVRWVLAKTGLKKYFKVIIDSTGIKNGKPAPDIFLKAAKKLKVPARQCIVFEDAMMGIEAAKRAGMKVIGVATSHRPSELKHTDLVVKDFTKLSLKKIQDHFD